MWKGFPEIRVTCDHDEALYPALVEDPGISLVLRINVVMHNNLDARSSKLVGQQIESEISVNKIAEFTPPSVEGNV